MEDTKVETKVTWKEAIAYKLTTKGLNASWLTWTPRHDLVKSPDSAVIKPSTFTEAEPVRMEVRSDCEVRYTDIDGSWFCYCPARAGGYTIPYTVSQALARGLARFHGTDDER